MNKSNSFKELQSEWYKRLKDSGFKDLESESEREFGWVTKQSPTYDPTRYYHFKRCEAFLVQFWGGLERCRWKDKLDVPSKFHRLFDNPMNQFIFETYCQGATDRAIAGLLESHGFKGISHVGVYKRIQNLLKDAEIDECE